MRQLTGSYLSIGAGENQIPLIQAAKARGLKVISVDINPEAPGLLGSDIRILESTHEYRKIHHAMSRVPLPFKLLGVGSRSFGKAIYTVSYLAEKLKLRGNPRDTVNLFLDKERFKNSVTKFGIPIPPSLQSSLSNKSKEKKIEIVFPVIAKPKEGSGKKGISVLESDTDYKKFIRLKTSESYLLEPFISGDEITVLGFVIARRFYLISLTDKITTGKPNFIEVAHVAPSRHIDMAGEIKMICQAVVTATKLKTGPFVAEFKITKNKECLLIESAPEVGGEFLADVLIPEHYGYKYFNDLLSVTIGEKTRPGFLKKAKDGITKSALVFTLPKERQKKMGEPVTLEANTGEIVFFQKQLVETGANLEKLEGNHKRTQVFGISTKQTIDTKDWLDSIFQRINS